MVKDLRSEAVAIGDQAARLMLTRLALPPDGLSGMLLDAWRFEVVGGAYAALRAWEASIVAAGVDPDEANIARFHASLVVIAHVELAGAAAGATATAN